MAERFRSAMAYPATSGPHIPTQCPAPPTRPVTKRIHGRESVGHGKTENRLPGARRRHRRFPVVASARAPDDHSRAAVSAVGPAGEIDAVPSHLHPRHRQIDVRRKATLTRA